MYCAPVGARICINPKCPNLKIQSFAGNAWRMKQAFPDISAHTYLFVTQADAVWACKRFRGPQVAYQRG